jgi:hypothetical protein
MPRVIDHAVALRSAPSGESEVLGQLNGGDIFEVLELAGANAWGVAPRIGLVGYIDAAALTAEAA